MHASRRLLRQGSVYTLGTLLQLTAAAVVMPLLTRLLEPAQFGIVALALTIQILLSHVVGAGLPVAITRSFFDDGGGEAGRQLIVSTALIAIAVTALAALTAPLWIGALALGDAAPLAIAIGLAMPAAVSGSALALLRAQERPTAFLSVAMLSSVVAQAFGTGALVATGGGPLTYVVGYGCGVCAGAVAALLVTGAHRSAPGSPTLLRSSLAIGLPTVPVTLSAFVLSTGDRFVIQAIDGAASVGRYQVAYAVGTLALTFLSALNLAWVPITFGLDADERWPTLARMTTLVARIAALLAAILALGAPLALRVMAPAEYEVSQLVPVTALVALAAVPWTVILATGQILLWQRDMRPLYWIAPLATTLNLVLAALLLAPFGLTGVAMATLVALTAQAALMHRAATARVAISWDARGLAGSVALAGLAVSAAIALPQDGAADAARLAGAAAVCVLAARTIRAQMLSAPTA